ncbi:hypothetical protein GIS00_08125 [Nakamurella sp. YIM 132087]|uniref:Uncharacterized protein n=1 Tax=Nakamurella alba TaxID=2665158 RepID=A0A7K1FII0_9ACTN|nr:hypothetical protein [Nakamurella alba]MTD13908.1 hypothetical protein [Nakamurella alba]
MAVHPEPLPDDDLAAVRLALVVARIGARTSVGTGSWIDPDPALRVDPEQAGPRWRSTVRWD